ILTPMTAVAAETPMRGFFASRDGMQLYHEIWPSPTTPQGTLLFVHGYGEHCGRYKWPTLYFTSHGYDCVAFDYRGHGQATGARGHCLHFDEFLGDLEAALDLARTRGVNRPLFIVAHSHGALIAMRYCLSQGAKLGGIKGLVLSSPFFGLQLKPPAAKVAAA